MGLMIAATAASGLIASKLLLEAGLGSVLIRYPLCVLIAYGVFIGLIRIWIGYIRLRETRSTRAGIPEGLDLVQIPSPDLDKPAGFGGFGGGDSGGGGASDSWGIAEPATAGGSPVEVGGVAADLDDGLVLLIVFVVVALSVFCAGGYVIYVAPQILSDVAFTAVLAPAMARAAKRAETGGWIRTVLRRTLVPLAVVLIVTVAAGVAMSNHCPGARTVIEALGCSDERPR
jgi:hypothetical protein